MAGIVEPELKQLPLFNAIMVFYLLIFPKGFIKSRRTTKSFDKRFLKHYFLFLGLILFGLVLVMQVAYIKDRWLQPLLFVYADFFLQQSTATLDYIREIQTFSHYCRHCWSNNLPRFNHQRIRYIVYKKILQIKFPVQYNGRRSS